MTRAADAASRHAARERALELLYEVESKDETVPAVLAELPLAPDELAAGLVEGVERRGEEVDGFVSRFAKGWSVGRMPAVDRAVLRLGTYELLAADHVPTAVVLSEWVTLAGEYSTTESSRFVNGVLSRIAQEIRPDDAGNAPTAADSDLMDGDAGNGPHGDEASEADSDAGNGPHGDAGSEADGEAAPAGETVADGGDPAP